LAIVVPAADEPHLVYRNEYFEAPIRNNADTVWMKVRQIEAMYRARFEERRHAAEALDHLYSELVAGRDTDHRAWLIAVGRPRVTPTTITRWDRDEARDLFKARQRANSCVRCALLRADPAQRPRLEEIRKNLEDRIIEAKRQGWLGAAEGLQVSLTGANDKLTQIKHQPQQSRQPRKPTPPNAFARFGNDFTAFGGENALTKAHCNFELDDAIVITRAPN
jgi:hypothetical protein